MQNTLLKLPLAAFIAFTFVPQAALAEETLENWLDSFYVSGFLGGSFLHEVVTGTSYTGDANSYVETYEQGMGGTARLALGSQVNKYLRTELELGFSRSNQGSIREVINGALPANMYQGHGHLDTITLMGNVWADIPILDDKWGITPYLGGGLGAALVKSNLVYTNFPAYAPQGSSLQFAAQLGAGVNWAINDTLSAGLGYRATFITGPEISQATGANQTTTYRFDNLISHSVGVTLMVSMN